MQEAYEKMNLNDLAAKTAAIIEANKGRTFAEIEKPAEPEGLLKQ